VQRHHLQRLKAQLKLEIKPISFFTTTVSKKQENVNISDRQLTICRVLAFRASTEVTTDKMNPVLSLYAVSLSEVLSLKNVRSFFYYILIIVILIIVILIFVLIRCTFFKFQYFVFLLILSIVMDKIITAVVKRCVLKALHNNRKNKLQ